MAAPTLSTRGTPAGIKLDDGYRTVISPFANTTIEFWEITVQPPGVDGMEPVNTTTMHNTRWRTKGARHLITMTDVLVKAAYNPKLYAAILALINVETSWTVKFPDGSTLVFYGFLQKFEPDALEEGKMPEANVTIVVTNQDPTTGAETDPVYTDVAGT